MNWVNIFYAFIALFNMIHTIHGKHYLIETMNKRGNQAKRNEFGMDYGEDSHGPKSYGAPKPYGYRKPTPSPTTTTTPTTTTCEWDQWSAWSGKSGCKSQTVS